MDSLIIPVAILLMVGAWGVWETGRKFRAEFRRRGKAWESVCADMSGGVGMLVVDVIWGPQRGLGHPVIWWLTAEPVPGEDVGAIIESGAALLVRCPRKLRSAELLRGEFGEARVIVHSWAVGRELLETAGENR